MKRWLVIISLGFISSQPLGSDIEDGQVPLIMSQSSPLLEIMDSNRWIMSSTLSRDDINKIQSQLQELDTLKSLVVEHMIDFDTDNLSIPKLEADRRIKSYIRQTKLEINDKLKNSLYKKMKVPSIYEAHQRYQRMLDDLELAENFDQRSISQASLTLSRFPRYRDYVTITIQAFPEVYNKVMLTYFQDFFSVANTYKPQVSSKIKNIINTLQSEFQFMPESYYQKIRTTYKGKMEEESFDDE